jgi:hypothetical protein
MVEGMNHLTLNVGPMTVESGFQLTLNFTTLYLGKTKSLHFQQMKDMSCNIFMNFVKILKLLWIFKEFVKKIHINYKVYSQTSIFFIVWVNHNRQHNDGWKSSVILKLVIFTTHVVNAKLLIAINHSIFKFFHFFFIWIRI